MSIELNYLSARDRIKDGDIISIFRPAKVSALQLFVFSTIKFFTGSSIFHSVVAFWMSTSSGERKLMCVESNIRGGKRIVPLSLYAGFPMEVHPLPPEFSFKDMENLALRRVGAQSYSVLDFVGIGLKEFFGFKVKNFNNQVCSELCADLWSAAGFPFKETVVSPGRLKRMLLDEGVEVSISIPGIL